MGEAGAEDAHAVAEGVFQGFQDSTLFYANLDGILLAEQRQVQQALQVQQGQYNLLQDMPECYTQKSDNLGKFHTHIPP